MTAWHGRPSVQGSRLDPGVKGVGLRRRRKPGSLALNAKGRVKLEQRKEGPKRSRDGAKALIGSCELKMATASRLPSVQKTCPRAQAFGVWVLGLGDERTSVFMLVRACVQPARSTHRINQACNCPLKDCTSKQNSITSEVQYLLGCRSKDCRI